MRQRPLLLPPKVTTKLRRNSACPGCGLMLAVHAGPTHAYVGATPACWEHYRQLSSPPYTREMGSRLRRLVEDTYAAQHPGVPCRRAMQSVAIHLMGLCVLIEREGEERRLIPILGRMPARTTLGLHWLAPPVPNGKLTVVDVVKAGPDAAHGPAVEAWARDVWKAWSPHHATVRGWLDAKTLRVA
jgi:hypothetical protein